MSLVTWASYMTGAQSVLIISHNKNIKQTTNKLDGPFPEQLGWAGTRSNKNSLQSLLHRPRHYFPTMKPLRQYAASITSARPSQAWENWKGYGIQHKIFANVTGRVLLSVHGYCLSDTWQTSSKGMQAVGNKIEWMTKWETRNQKWRIHCAICHLIGRTTRRTISQQNQTRLILLTECTTCSRWSVAWPVNRIMQISWPLTGWTWQAAGCVVAVVVTSRDWKYGYHVLDRRWLQEFNLLIKLKRRSHLEMWWKFLLLYMLPAF